MKVNEILIEELTVLQRKATNASHKPNATLGNFALQRQYKHDTSRPNPVLGAGIEAIVFKSSKASNQNTVTKWIRRSDKDSQTNITIQYLMKASKLNSTASPVVYSITQHQTSVGYYDFSIQMERLQFTLDDYCKKLYSATTTGRGDYEKTSFEEDTVLIEQLLNNIYTEDAVQRILISWHDACANKTSPSMKRSGGWFVDLVTNSIYKNDQSFIPSIQKIIDLLHKDFKYYLDIHGGNMMIRLTSVGPQLVITDPVIS